MSDYPLVRAHTDEIRSPYNRVLALVLCWFLGLFGVHRFYVGKFFTGVLMLLTGGGFGIWWLIDFVLLLLGRFTDSEGRVLGPPQVEYRQLPPPPQPPRHHEPRLAVDPELAPLPEEPTFDDDLMRDPLEDKFADLERELGGKD